MFARQNDFSKRAVEVWDTMKHNGQWPLMASFTYAEPAQFPQLQAADMLAYKSYQYLKAGLGEAWRSWPLLNKLVQKELVVRL